MVVFLGRCFQSDFGHVRHVCHVGHAGHGGHVGGEFALVESHDSIHDGHVGENLHLIGPKKAASTEVEMI